MRIDGQAMLAAYELQFDRRQSLAYVQVACQGIHAYVHVSVAVTATRLRLCHPGVTRLCELTAYAPLALFIVALHTGIDPYVVNIFSKRL